MNDETYTPDQIESMRQAVAQYDAEQLAAAMATENARLQAVRDYVHSDAYTALCNGIDALYEQYKDDPLLAPQLNCLVVGLPGALNAAGPLPATTDA